eukprot:563812-Rhodomonas_salina.2
MSAPGCVGQGHASATFQERKPEGRPPTKRCGWIVGVFLISGRWIPQGGDPRIKNTRHYRNGCEG